MMLLKEKKKETQINAQEHNIEGNTQMRTNPQLLLNQTFF